MEPRPAGCAIQSSNGNGKSGPKIVTGACSPRGPSRPRSFAITSTLRWVPAAREVPVPVTAGSAGDGYVAVHGGRVGERGEHAGGQVGAGDRESVRQVAVDRGAVGAGRGLAGQRGRAEDRPVQVAVPDLVLAAAHVGADVAQERAPGHGLDQVAHVGAFALVGDDGTADLQEPPGTGLGHGRDDAVHAVLDDGRGAGAARAHRGQDGVRALDGRGDGGGVHDVGGDDPQPGMRRPGQPGGIADHRGDLVAGRERLADEEGSGGAGRAENGEFHRVLLYIRFVTRIIRRSYHMDSILPGDEGAGPHRGRLSRAVKESLRDLGAQLSLLNHSVGTRLDLKAADLECLDLITRYGPLSPSALARRGGLHPATLTGILDRLDRDGWIDRERDPADRRGVVVRAARGRGAEILRLYLVDSGMNTALDQICAGYDDQDLELLAGFLHRTAEAARTAAERLAAS